MPQPQAATEALPVALAPGSGRACGEGAAEGAAREAQGRSKKSTA